MASLRSLFYIVSIIYCVSVLIMLLNLPAIRHQLSLKIGQSGDLDSKPYIHPHILLRRMAEERCANLTHRYRTSPNISFSRIPGSEVSIMNAYLDRRLPGHPFIRLLVLMPYMQRRADLHCHLLVGERDFRVRAVLYQFNENHGMPYGGYVFSCPLAGLLAPDAPLCTVLVSEGANLTGRSVEVYLDGVPRRGRLRRLSSCVPPLFGRVEARRLIEFVELHSVLGVEHFHFYDFSERTEEAERVFSHYSARGVVTRMRWALPVARDAIWYNGQMLAIHHCLYATMGLSRFTAFHDLDEAFVPRRHPNLTALLAEIDAGGRHCGFRFFSAFFPPAPDAPPDELVSLRSRRTAAVSSTRTKCIVRPDLIFEMGIHHISKQNVEEKTPHNIAHGLLTIHHFRRCDRSFGMNCDDFAADTIVARRFGEALRRRFEETVRRVLPG